MSTRALYLHFEAGMDGAEFARLVDMAEKLGYRVIDQGAYVLLTRDGLDYTLKRKPFPGDNPQEIRCPMGCGGSARTSEDGTVYLCEHGHYGYYEHPIGVIIPEESWRLSPKS